MITSEKPELITLNNISYKNFDVTEPSVEVIRLFSDHIEIQSKVSAKRIFEDDITEKIYEYDYIFSIKKSAISEIECGFSNDNFCYETSIFTFHPKQSAHIFPCESRKQAFDLYNKLKNWWL